ncbi:MAG: Protein of unknown function (DUF1553)/Protein of unknown function (DUF1549)/Planctomycete [Akkermansiaceae bacterium]|nr:Protein of unknown function (DUF1553)/Protein of unknown function (DUF1549)/Planctomycete [Akkermansiaceae bacterium]
MRILAISLALAGGLSGAEVTPGHWSYQPPAAVEIPAGTNPVDFLLAASWQKAGLEPAPLAPPRQWLERAAFTLTGLPPSEDQLQKIAAHPDDATWRSLVDELLASPAYGERWARHWMDVARYADTRGYNFDQDNRYPFAYTYRDWLINAFNSDLPYAQFVKLQLAADLLVDKPDNPDVAALGFLTVGLRSGQLETVDDRVDVVTRGFLSSTVACARCHDHKFDPITTRDYYSLYSIFAKTDEPEDKPVIGQPKDAAAYQDYQVQVAKLDEIDRAARQTLVDHIHSKEAFPNYLDLSWHARQENWDQGKAISEGFKRGRLRPNPIMRWKDFLNEAAFAETSPPRLKEWAAAMDQAADDPARTALCQALATEWLAAAAGSDLAALSAKPNCPLSYGIDRINQFYDQQDGNEMRKRAGDMAKLMTEHPGSPPRAMVVTDKKQWSDAVIFVRGNPDNKGETFPRQWLSMLGGGEYPAGKSPRLSLAEKIADPANPLTSRAIVNRIWGWQFGANLAEPGDFGMQTPTPELLPLLDQLAVEFGKSGGSIKELQRLLVTSKAFRLAAAGPEKNDRIDEANTHFWKWRRQRLDFESMRDRVLASAGTLDTHEVGGRSVGLESAASDPRRTTYAFIDRFVLPGIFVSFDLPHPDHHSPRRVETIVPQQALYFLNSPLVLRQAAKLAQNPEFTALQDNRQKVEWIYKRLYQRDATPAEQSSAAQWIESANPADYAPRLGGFWQVLHGVDTGAPGGQLESFPIFADKVWKTGPDPATAPIRWLNVSASGGHPSAGHSMVLRWQASSPGKVRMTGHLGRTQKGGATLAWRIDGKGQPLAEAKLDPEGAADISSPWVDVRTGDTMDFVLRAPNGDSCGGTSWKLSIEGHETDAQPIEEVGNFTRQFPTSSTPAPGATAADPWADLIQMLWASNEFHYID